MKSMFGPLRQLLTADHLPEAADWLKRFRRHNKGVNLHSEDRDTLRELLFHPDTAVRQQAVLAVGTVGDIEAVPLLTKLYAQGLDPFDHDFIFDTFVRLGERAVPLLEELTRSEFEWERVAAWWGLGLIGGPALPLLAQGIDQRNKTAVEAAANAHHPDLVESLLGLLQEGGELAGPAASTLSSCVDESCTSYTEKIIGLLRRFGLQSATGVSLLEALAALNDLRALPTLVWALKTGGDNADYALEGLAHLPSREAVHGMTEVVRRKGVPAWLRGEILKAILEHPLSTTAEKREAARQALDRFDTQMNYDEAVQAAASTPACDRQLAALEDSLDAHRRLSLAVAYAESDRSRAAKHLHFATRHGGRTVLRRCAELVFEIDLDAAEPLIGSPETGIRRALAQALPFSTSEPEVYQVARRLVADRKAEVREEAVRRLGALREEALPLLEAMARDRSRKVREAAAATLASLPLDPSTPAPIDLMARYLWDPKGRPVDPIIGEIHYPDGRVEVETLSKHLIRLDDHGARRHLQRWHLALEG